MSSKKKSEARKPEMASDLAPDPEDQRASDPFVTAMSGAEEFAGVALQPWNPERKVAAQGMGFLYPHIGEEGFDQLQRVQTYPGMQKDIIIFLWLRTRESLAVVRRALRKPLEAFEVAMRWAETSELIDMDTDAFAQGYALFCQKMEAEQAARCRPNVDASSATGGAGPNV